MEEVKITNIHALSIKAAIECEANRPMHEYVAEMQEEKQFRRLFESLDIHVNNTACILDCVLCDLHGYEDGCKECPIYSRDLCEPGTYYKKI